MLDTLLTSCLGGWWRYSLCFHTNVAAAAQFDSLRKCGLLLSFSCRHFGSLLGKHVSIMQKRLKAIILCMCVCVCGRSVRLHVSCLHQSSRLSGNSTENESCSVFITSPWESLRSASAAVVFCGGTFKGAVQHFGMMEVNLISVCYVQVQ